MADLSKAMLFSHHFRPLFNGSTFYLYGVSTALTYKVMVMRFSAEAVDSFAIFSSQDINNLVIHKTL
jgi:hypothetical protein